MGRGKDQIALGMEQRVNKMAIIIALSSVLQEVVKPKQDPLHGLRVHAWVLVLPGKRKVPETFFINPFTGNPHSTTDECFLGIESIWNDRNYWVNMQDCRKGCKVGSP